MATPPELPPDNRSGHGLKWLWRLLVVAVSITAILLVGLYLWFQRDSARTINYAVALVPVGLSILIAFVPDLRKARMAWRIGIVAVGLAWSVLLWRQQVLAEKEQNEAWARIISVANEHTDKQIGTVGEGLKKATEHSDQQISVVRDDLKGAMGTLGKLVSNTETNLNASIGKVGKPDPPDLASLQFTLVQENSTEPLLAALLRADKDGFFEVTFSALNTSKVAIHLADVWIDVCDRCKFAKEPAGLDKPAGMRDQTRHMQIYLLNPGAALPKETIYVSLLDPAPGFDIGLRYSCEACVKTPPTQKARITIGKMPWDGN